MHRNVNCFLSILPNEGKAATALLKWAASGPQVPHGQIPKGTLRSMLRSLQIDSRRSSEFMRYAYPCQITVDVEELKGERQDRIQCGVSGRLRRQYRWLVNRRHPKDGGGLLAVALGEYVKDREEIPLPSALATRPSADSGSTDCCGETGALHRNARARRQEDATRKNPWGARKCGAANLGSRPSLPAISSIERALVDRSGGNWL